jgi:hypothetical protein
MSTIHTKDGRPLQSSGDDLFSRSGKHVARLSGAKAYGPDGRYVGTLVGDRLVYRSTDSAAISSPFARQARAGSATARAAGSALWGDEPPIPD